MLKCSFTKGRFWIPFPTISTFSISRFREKALFQIGKGYFFENKFREAITNLDILLLEFPNSEYLEEGLFIKGRMPRPIGKFGSGIRNL